MNCFVFLQSTVNVYVNRLDSVESVLPYEYTHFDFCQASDDERSPSENLGQVVFGERIRPSPFKVVIITLDFKF
jgi:transmembrane 9 superfamily member 2/4